MSILSCSYFSKARKSSVTFHAVLPTELPPMRFDAAGEFYSNGPFPTIYLLHGYTGGHNDWLVRSRIEQWAMEHRYAVIMPGGTNHFYLDNEDTEEKHGEFVGCELVEVTRKMFPLSRNREDTVIGGLSMGGYGAIRNGMKYHQTFGAIIALSSALITDEITSMKEGDHNGVAGYRYYHHVFGDLTRLPGSDKDPKRLASDLVSQRANLPRLFLACGSEDFLYQKNLDFHQYLDTIAYPHTWWVRPGVHDFDFWNISMLEAIKWLG